MKSKWVLARQTALGVFVFIAALLTVQAIQVEVGWPSELSRAAVGFCLATVMALGAYWAFVARRQTLGASSCATKPWWALVAFVALAVWVVAVGYSASHFLKLRTEPTIHLWTSALGSADLLPNLLAAVDFVALEEVLFRGLIFGVALRCLSVNRALEFQAIVFGLMHLLPGGGIGLALATYLLGLGIGALFIKYRSIMLCIFIHAGWNAGIAVYYDAIQPYCQGFDPACFSSGVGYFTGILLLLPLLVVYYDYLRNRNRNKGTEAIRAD